jgi:hypothetical protein
MGKRKKKRPAKLSDQLRHIIETENLSRYEISKQSGVDASQLHRFFCGTGRLTTDSLDKVGAVLKLRFVQD